MSHLKLADFEPARGYRCNSVKKVKLVSDFFKKSNKKLPFFIKMELCQGGEGPEGEREIIYPGAKLYLNQNDSV